MKGQGFCGRNYCFSPDTHESGRAAVPCRINCAVVSHLIEPPGTMSHFCVLHWRKDVFIPFPRRILFRYAVGDTDSQLLYGCKTSQCFSIQISFTSLSSSISLEKGFPFISHLTPLVAVSQPRLLQVTFTAHFPGT